MPHVPTVYAIDFGTSNSLLAAASEERVFDPIPLDPAAPDDTILRSILCFPDSGGAYVGAEALRQYVDHGSEARLLRSIKHHLGSRSFRGTVIRGRMITPEALVAVVLRAMRERAAAWFGAHVRRVVLGRPVHFDGDDDAFAEARLRKAAELAGFEDVHLVPRAGRGGARLRRRHRARGARPRRGLRRRHVGLHGAPRRPGGADAGRRARRRRRRRRGGRARRLPHAIARRAPLRRRGPVPGAVREERAQDAARDRAAPLLARAPVDPAAARRRLVPRGRPARVALRRGPCPDRPAHRPRGGHAGFQLFEVIEGAKRTLSSEERAEVVYSHPGIDVREPVTRDAFEDASRREIAAIVACMEGTVLAAGVRAEDVAVACCTGGTAKVPRLAAEIRRLFPRARVEDFEGFHSVVEGLAHEARAVAGTAG